MPLSEIASLVKFEVRCIRLNNTSISGKYAVEARPAKILSLVHQHFVVPVELRRNGGCVFSNHARSP